jgi:hypothetical protein
MPDWDELQQPKHAAMLEDVKQMICVRRQVATLLGLPAAEKEPQLMPVPHQSDVTVPVPYVRWNEHAAILVIANRDASHDAHLTLHIPLEETGWGGRARYKVTPLWPAGESNIHSQQELENFACTITRDKTQAGGLRVLKIEGAS